MKKTVEKEEKQVKQETKLREAFVLWKNKSKKGEEYLTGNTSDECGELAGAGVVAFYNSNKENPKAPDIRVYVKGENDKNIEVASLWENVSQNEKRYLTGSTNEKEKLVGFYTKDVINGRPDIRVYFKD